MSGFRPAAYANPSVILSLDQLNLILQEYLEAVPSARADYDAVMANQPAGLSYGIPKREVYINVKQNATDVEITKLKNLLVQTTGDNQVYGFNARKFNKDLQDNMIILYAMTALVSVILYLLTLFELIVTTSSNIRDDSTELGVLR